MIAKIQKILSKVLNTFKNIMKNGAFAPMEQMLYYPYFQIHAISKALQLWSEGLTHLNRMKFSNAINLTSPLMF